jgi:methylmalonyl-CoA/ethylmalonyl-CoA epimerase
VSETASKVKAVDHLAIAVADLNEAVLLFERLLGVEPAWVRSAPDHDVRIAMFVLGNMKVELLEGISAASTVTQFVETHGAGLHHVCYTVEDLKATVRRLNEGGFELLGTGDERGVEGRPVVFLHPGSTGGVLTEFIEGEAGRGEPADEGSDDGHEG